MTGGAASGAMPPPGAWALDAGLAVLLLAAAWQGSRRGGLVAVAGLATFAATAWLVATRAADIQAWAARSGWLARLSALITPLVTAWLPPEVARAPVQPADLLRLLDVLNAMPLPPGVRDEWWAALREAARAAGPDATVGSLLATVVASGVVADLTLYGLPLATGFLLSLLARRGAALLHARGWGAGDRLLGFVAGGLEGALLAAGLLVLAHHLAALAPGVVDPRWWQALDQSRLAAWLTGAWDALWPALMASRGA